MGKKASEIERILSGKITNGDNTISLNESDHKAVLQALLILLGSAVNHSDAESAGSTVLEFVSDVKKAELNNMIFEITDNVKTMQASGKVIGELAGAFFEGVITTQNVERGGSRAGSTKTVVKLGELA